MLRPRHHGGRHRSNFGAIIALSLLVVAAVGWAPSSARADDPPALGTSVAVNDALARNVVAGVTQTDASTSADATASRIGFFTATPTGATVNFAIVSQTTAVPAAGVTSSTALYMLTAAGVTYRAAIAADGTFEVTQLVEGAYTNVGTATFSINGQLTEIDVQAGAWTAAGTNIVIVRRDLDPSLNGWESATPPVLLDALVGRALGGAIPLLNHGTALGADGLSNTSCAIANMPTVSLDATTNAVTFTFAQPPAADVRGTIGGVSLSDLVNPPYVSGLFGAATWNGKRAGASIGDFAVTVAGNAVRVATSNATDSIFATNHLALTIGISDPAGCYSLSPAVPFSILLAPSATAASGVTTSSVLIPTTTTTAVAGGGSVGGAATTIAGAVSTTIATTPSADTAVHETFDNSNPTTPWGKIIIVGLLAVVLGSIGGVLLTRWDRKRTAARTRGGDAVDDHDESGSADGADRNDGAD